jgi:hypothetical protein
MEPLIAWFWSFLPDKCEVEGCSRRGVRGNENFIDGRAVCDYCHAKMHKRESRRSESL